MVPNSSVSAAKITVPAGTRACSRYLDITATSHHHACRRCGTFFPQMSTLSSRRVVFSGFALCRRPNPLGIKVASRADRVSVDHFLAGAKTCSLGLTDVLRFLPCCSRREASTGIVFTASAYIQRIHTRSRVDCVAQLRARLAAVGVAIWQEDIVMRRGARGGSGTCGGGRRRRRGSCGGSSCCGRRTLNSCSR